MYQHCCLHKTHTRTSFSIPHPFPCPIRLPRPTHQAPMDRFRDEPASLPSPYSSHSSRSAPIPSQPSHNPSNGHLGSSKVTERVLQHHLTRSHPTNPQNIPPLREKIKKKRTPLPSPNKSHHPTENCASASHQAPTGAAIRTAKRTTVMRSYHHHPNSSPGPRFSTRTSTRWRRRREGDEFLNIRRNRFSGQRFGSGGRE